MSKPWRTGDEPRVDNWVDAWMLAHSGPEGQAVDGKYSPRHDLLDTTDAKQGLFAVRFTVGKKTRDNAFGFSAGPYLKHWSLAGDFTLHAWVKASATSGRIAGALRYMMRRATRRRPIWPAWRRTEGGGNTLGRLPRCSPRTGSMPELSGQCRSRRRCRRERVCGSTMSFFIATRRYSGSATKRSRNSWPRPRRPARSAWPIRCRIRVPGIHSV